MKTVSQLTNPALSDAVVQTIGSDLITLDWLEYVFPIAEVNGDDDGNTYPIVYLEDGTSEYQSLLPDDSVTAFCFFIDNGFDIGFDGELNTYNLSLYVWARLDLIDTNNNDFTMSLINDVLIKLHDNECFNINVTIRNPFSEFTALDQYINSNIKRKRTGFRIDFSIYGDNNMCESNL